MTGPPIPAVTGASAKKIRVAVVGAGSAGSSCAYALSKLPSQYEVTIFDKEFVSGGMATSVNIDASKCVIF
jgi:protoporphyrinogen oxidase